MEIVRTPEEMQQRALELKRSGRVIGFVPTMGYLHEGHLSLMRMARDRCDVLVVSIFVNPTQFGPGEDLEAYPRDFERDEALCRQEGVHIVFYPEPSAMYGENASVWVDEESLSEVLCGASRPGHFRGVCTVVTKLFNLVQPDLAVFGEKDAQQLRILERMVRDLNFPVQILRGPIVREADGLAMSSRNRYLSEEQRSHACGLKQSLELARTLIERGERRADSIRAAMVDRLRTVPDSTVDYLSIVDDETLQETAQLEGRTLIALAVRIGPTRLIDNMVVEV